MEKTTIVTRPGVFNVNQLMAIAVIALANDNATVLYNSEETTINLDKNTIFVGMNGGRYDHHSKEHLGLRNNSNIPFAESGLSWADYGPSIVKKFVNDLSQEQTESICKRVDSSLMKGIDKNELNLEPVKNNPEGALKNLAECIKIFNTTWLNEGEEKNNFFKALEFVKEILIAQVKLCSAEILANDIFAEAVKEQEEKHPNLLVLKKYFPFMRHLHAQKKDKILATKFAIYPTSAGNWAIKTLPKTKGVPMIPFPKELLGKKREDGLIYATYVHEKAFIAFADSQAEAIKFAEYIIALNEN